MVALTKDVDAQQRLAAFVAKWLVTSGKNPGADGSLPRGIHSAPALRPEEAGTSSLNTDGCDWSDAAAHHWLVANDDRRRFDKTCELSRLLVQVRRTAIEEARDLCLDKARELRSDPLDVEGRMSLAAIECAARVGASLKGTENV
jgi:hypothetical protein